MDFEPDRPRSQGDPRRGRSGVWQSCKARYTSACIHAPIPGQASRYLRGRETIEPRLLCPEAEFLHQGEWLHRPARGLSRCPWSRVWHSTRIARRDLPLLRILLFWLPERRIRALTGLSTLAT